jgi:hypothetical protein
MAHDSQLDAASDAELLRDARRSSGAFRILYDRHAARIHAFHLRRSRDRGAAVELTAETFASRTPAPTSSTARCHRHPHLRRPTSLMRKNSFSSTARLPAGASARTVPA